LGDGFDGLGSSRRAWGLKAEPAQHYPEMQETILENFKDQNVDQDRTLKSKKGKSKKKKAPKKRSDDEYESDQIPAMIGITNRSASVGFAGHAQSFAKRAGSMPAAQIAPTSSVGIALGDIAHKHDKYYGFEDDGSGGDSSPSDSSDYGDTTTTVLFRSIWPVTRHMACGLALILVDVKCHIGFGRMRKMVQKKALKSKFRVLRIYLHGLRCKCHNKLCSKMFNTCRNPRCCHPSRHGTRKCCCITDWVVYAFSHIRAPYQHYHSHCQWCPQTSLPHCPQQEHPYC
jgi:hypothetical protein